MGPEILIAILGPVVGGSVTLFVWITRRNADQLNTGLSSINTSVNVIERKIDDLRVDVAKNYVTNEDLKNHIKGEEEWHIRFTEDLSEMKQDIRDMRNFMDRSQVDYKNYGG